ncbi:MAG: PIN domain-containing protein [Candidatus Woesearchaeota archaeon]
MIIVLDTNFVFIPFTHKVDVIEELSKIIATKFIIMQKTLDELDKLIEQNEKHAKLAKQFALEHCEIVAHSSADTADDAIVSYCLEHTHAIVATQDKLLKKRLQEIGTTVAILRQKNHIELV